MLTYNFKRESKVYVVRNGLRYLLDVYPDLSFSQTFEETTVPVKTLHSQYDMFENAVITKANPANFNFTVPILYQADMNILFELLLDYDNTSGEALLKTADLYIEANSEVYKLEKCVLESGVFQISNTAVLTMSLSGTARKLSKHTGVIPGTLAARTGRTFGRVTALMVKLGTLEQSGITSVSLEMRNNITWVDFATIHKSRQVTSASETSFPEAFVVGSRALSGTVQQYITNESNQNVNSWSTTTPMTITAGIPGAALLEFILPSVVYTNRLEVQDFYIQSYDFRMNVSPSSLSTVIKKN